uniref:Uracil-DNA glycosylase n=1 Tax=Geladintestivirus 1 TaxID=3233133 RepID=A0AAU8MHD7_9CAUD
MLKNNCNNCALRLFNDKCYNISGNGAWINNAFIIISNIDNNAYKHKDIDFSKQIEIMNSIAISSTGGEKVTDVAYLTPLIKCREVNYIADSNTINCCIKNLGIEFKTYNPKYILVTGSAVERFLNTNIHDNLNKIFVTKNNRYYFVNYSPFIKEYDTIKFELFKKYLIKFINVIKTNNMNEYEILRI